MIKRILVGLGDVEHSANAVRHAVDLCKQHNAELTAVTVVDHQGLDNVGPIPVGGGAAAQELREHRHKQIIEKAIEQCERTCEEAGLPFQLVFEEGQPLDAICCCARFNDLMILGRDATLFEHGVIEEPSDELVRLVSEGVRPILTVTRETGDIRRVLVAYSGSMESAKTVRRFIQLRAWPDSEMRIVRFNRPDQEVQCEVEEAAAYCRSHGFEVEAECIPGSPKESLLPLADDWGADLLVVGNSAKSLLLRKLFGETALNVIRNATQAVFMSQ